MKAGGFSLRAGGKRDGRKICSKKACTDCLSGSEKKSGGILLVILPTKYFLFKTSALPWVGGLLNTKHTLPLWLP